MSDEEIYQEPSEVTAKDGTVKLDGPDSVDVTLTPEAAEETPTGWSTRPSWPAASAT
jgi:hypothetical protein